MLILGNSCNSWRLRNLRTMRNKSSHTGDLINRMLCTFKKNTYYWGGAMGNLHFFLTCHSTPPKTAHRFRVRHTSLTAYCMTQPSFQISRKNNYRNHLSNDPSKWINIHLSYKITYTTRTSENKNLISSYHGRITVVTQDHIVIILRSSWQLNLEVLFKACSISTWLILK